MFKRQAWRLSPGKNSVRDFFLHYHTTPNASTGVAPSELFLGCKLRTRTTLHILHTGPSTEATVQARVNARQSQVKTYTHIKCAAKPSVLRPGDRLRVMSTHVKGAVKIQSTLYCTVLGGKKGHPCISLKTRKCGMQYTLHLEPFFVVATVIFICF